MDTLKGSMGFLQRCSERAPIIGDVLTLVQLTTGSAFMTNAVKVNIPQRVGILGLALLHSAPDT